MYINTTCWLLTLQLDMRELSKLLYSICYWLLMYLFHSEMPTSSTGGSLCTTYMYFTALYYINILALLVSSTWSWASITWKVGSFEVYNVDVGQKLQNADFLAIIRLISIYTFFGVIFWGEKHKRTKIS